MSARSIFIVGATSTICRRVALELVRPGDRVCLAARDLRELARVAADLRVRARPSLVLERPFDASSVEEHQPLVEDVIGQLGGIDVLIVGTGELGNQAAARSSPAAIKRIIDSNFTGIATLIAPVADHMSARGGGRIGVLSSVAGDRGRQSNYVYGSAKGGMATYLEGLENRVHSQGVSVTTIKLGFVDTKMVFGKPGMFLVADPTRAARSIAAHVMRGASVAYVPWFWRVIMAIIAIIPGPIFRRMRL